MKIFQAKKTSEAFHIRHRNFFVGLFIIVPLLTLPVVLGFAFGKMQLFEQWAILYVKFDGKTGLQKGSIVKVLDAKVGYVNKVLLDPNGYIDVQLRIKKSYLRLIQKDSKARLSQAGFMVGDMQLEIIRGSSRAGQAETGDWLEPEIPDGLDKTIAMVNKLLANIDGLVVDIQKGKGSIGELIQKDTLARLLNKTVRGADRFVLSLNGTMQGIDSLVGTFNTAGIGGQALIDSLNLMVASFNRLAASTDTLVGRGQSLPADLTNVMRGVEKDIKELEIILKAFQKNWLIKGGVKKVQESEGK